MPFNTVMVREGIYWRFNSTISFNSLSCCNCNRLDNRNNDIQHCDGYRQNILENQQYYSKICLKRPLKNRQNKGLKTDYRLMQVKSNAECSLGAFCNTLTWIKWQSVLKTNFGLLLEWLLITGFSVSRLIPCLVVAIIDNRNHEIYNCDG